MLFQGNSSVVPIQSVVLVTTCSLVTPAVGSIVTTRNLVTSVVPVANQKLVPAATQGVVPVPTQSVVPVPTESVVPIPPPIQSVALPPPVTTVQSVPYSTTSVVPMPATYSTQNVTITTSVPPMAT